MRKSVQLREVFQSPHAKVDTADGVIRDVRVLGPSSLNGRQYTKQAVQSAQELYEGSVVNFDHPHKDLPDVERTVADRAGWLENVRFKDGGLTADFHILKADNRAEKVLEAAERRPELFGLSHNVEGKTRRENGKTLVEEILRVRSVDVVSDPASTRSLFESIEQEERNMSTVTIKEFLNTLDKKEPGTKILREVVEQGLVDEEMPMEEPVEPEADADEQIKVALHTAAKAAVDDDSLGPAETAEKVEKILQAEEELLNGEGEEETEEEKEEPAAESKHDQATLGEILKEQRKLQKQLTEMKGQMNVEKPRSGMIMTESRTGNGEKSKDAKDFYEKVTR